MVEKYPQTFTVQIAQTTINTQTTLRVLLPITRVPSDRVTIMEIAKIDWCMTDDGSTEPAASERWLLSFSVVKPPATTAITTLLAQTDIFASKMRKYHTNGTPAVLWSEETSGTIDCTDADGHGVLVAAQQIWINFANNNAPNSRLYSFTFKFWFHFVEVGLRQFLGILQAQNTTTTQ
jgi:hypothetical protein